MCGPIICPDCDPQKITWTGCGEHVAHVQQQVPEELWCGEHGQFR